MNFPCVFPVKVMGANQDDFESLVVSIIKKHANVAEGKLVANRFSRNGRFVSITVHIQAESQAQLDAMYHELSAHERVLMMV
jgi:putative lipoic acid-binding regulatory protein